MKYLILLLATPLILISCNKDDELNENIPPKTVTYQISCNDCFVFWKDENGEQQNASNQDSSWEYTFEGKSGDLLELGVMNTQDTYGYTSASILLNGEVLNTCNSGCPITGAALVVDTLQ
jgi:hypothetical protein